MPPSLIRNPESGIQDVESTNFEPSKVSFNRATKKVLIAEDSPYILKLLSAYTEEAGYQTQTFSNGQDAWDYIASVLAQPGFKKVEEYFHLLITDIEMPQMDGLHLIKKIKADPKLKTLPCIVFSSMISPELSVKVKALGADGQITKPEIHTLVNLVDQKVLA